MCSNSINAEFINYQLQIPAIIEENV